MNRLIYKDFRFRQNFQNSEKVKISFLFLLNSRATYGRFRSFISLRKAPLYPLSRKSKEVLFSSYRKFQYFLSTNKNFFFTRARNHCLITGNSHSVYSHFKMSRMALREDILSGKGIFVKKSSW